MHIDDGLRAEDFAAKASDAMLAKFDHRKQPDLGKTCDLDRNRCGFHMDDVRRANSIANAATGALFDINFFDHAIS
jgi:hypothetical protein